MLWALDKAGFTDLNPSLWLLSLLFTLQVYFFFLLYTSFFCSSIYLAEHGHPPTTPRLYVLCRYIRKTDSDLLIQVQIPKEGNSLTSRQGTCCNRTVPSTTTQAVEDSLEKECWARPVVITLDILTRSFPQTSFEFPIVTISYVSQLKEAILSCVLAPLHSGF